LHLRNSVTKNKGIQRKYKETKGIIKKFNLYPNSEQQYRELKEAFERIEKPYTNRNSGLVYESLLMIIIIYLKENEK